MNKIDWDYYFNLLRSKIDSGVSPTKAAIELNMSRFIKIQNKTKINWTSDKYKILQSFIDELPKKTLTEIGDLLGIQRSTVRSAVIKGKLTYDSPKYVPWTQQEIDYLKISVPAGKTYNEICAIITRHQKTDVMKYIKKHENIFGPYLGSNKVDSDLLPKVIDLLKLGKTFPCAIRMIFGEMSNGRVSSIREKIRKMISKEEYESFKVTYNRCNLDKETLDIEINVNLLSNSQIAKKYNTTENSVYWRIREFGLKRKTSSSLGEDMISKVLTDLNLQFETQYKCFNLNIPCRSQVKIDFRLSIKNTTIWIEYNGEQHYNKDSFDYLNKGSSDFIDQLTRDSYIRRYTKDNGIVFIEIPYTYTDIIKIHNLLRSIILDGQKPEDLIDLSGLFLQVQSYGINPIRK